MPSQKPTTTPMHCASQSEPEGLPDNKSTDICFDLEQKYLGASAHVPSDKYFRMLYAGMTKAEAAIYEKEKMRRLRESHGLSAL